MEDNLIHPSEILLESKDHKELYHIIKEFILNEEPSFPKISNLFVTPEPCVYLYSKDFNAKSDPSMYILRLKFGGEKSGRPKDGLLKRTCAKAENKLTGTVEQVEVIRYDIVEETTKKRKTEDGKNAGIHPSLIIVYGLKNYQDTTLITNDNENMQVVDTVFQNNSNALGNISAIQALQSNTQFGIEAEIKQAMEELNNNPQAFWRAVSSDVSNDQLFSWVKDQQTDLLRCVPSKKLTEARDEIDRTLLHSCKLKYQHELISAGCYYGHIDLLETLLQLVSDQPQQKSSWVTQTNRHQFTPLHTIVKSKLVKPDQRVKLVDLILSACQDQRQQKHLINALNRNMETALSIAEEQGMIDVIDYLQKQEAVPLSELTITLCVSFPAQFNKSPITEPFPKNLSVRTLLQNILPKHMKEYYAKNKNHITKWKLKSQEGELFDGNTKISSFHDKQKLLIELEE